MSELDPTGCHATLMTGLGDAIIGEVARQTESAVGNTGHDDYSDLSIGGLDGDQGHITLNHSQLAAVALGAIEFAGYSIVPHYELKTLKRAYDEGRLLVAQSPVTK